MKRVGADVSDVRVTRRVALAAGVALVTGAGAADTPVIDTHTHFYDPSRPQGVPWPGKGSALYRTVLPPEYKKIAAPLGVTGTVVVEASPWVEDNQWLLDVAKDEPFVVGVVGRLDLADADFAKNLARFAKNRLFRGIRAGEADARAALADPARVARLKALAEGGLTLDLNGRHETFATAAKVAEAVPALRVVVNHLGNPPVDGKEPPEAWRKAIAACGAANLPNLWCKLSGLVDGTGKRDGTAPADAAFYRPVLDAAWAAFGADRLVYGSNWPVSAQNAPLAAVHKLAADYAAGKGAFARVLGANARAAYRLV